MRSVFNSNMCLTKCVDMENYHGLVGARFVFPIRTFGLPAAAPTLQLSVFRAEVGFTPFLSLALVPLSMRSGSRIIEMERV